MRLEETIKTIFVNGLTKFVLGVGEKNGDKVIFPCAGCGKEMGIKNHYRCKNYHNMSCYYQKLRNAGKYDN